MKALVIDDSRMIRKMLRQTLTPLGFEVHEAENGREGLERFRELQHPDLILVDWNMPEMDGIDFVRALRNEEHFAANCVMMVTTQAEGEHVVTALEAGVDEYLMKPFTPEMIRDKLVMLGIQGVA
jgi:two-component system, chemotaxis family, chemotaxis protein CheY